MRQGDPGSHVFILAAGRVKIARVDSEGNELLLAVRGVGDIVGELAVLGGGLRSATVTALDAELLGHLLLGSLHSDLVLRLLRRGETERLTATLHELITTLLPAEPPNYYNT
jgi:hypothetical protein